MSLNRCKARLHRMIEETRARRRQEEMSPEGENEQSKALIAGAVNGDSSPNTNNTTTTAHAEASSSADYTGVGQQKKDGRGKVNGVLTEKKSLPDNNEGEANEVTTIPISTCLSVFFCYILFGSILFSWWEGWEYFEGSYFCFVSLVTIGFSDMVPGRSRSIGLALAPSSHPAFGVGDSGKFSSGSDNDSRRPGTGAGIDIGSRSSGGGGSDDDGHGNGIGSTSASGTNGREESLSLDQVDGQLILCSIYILFGMALMAMCFHLTQERFFATAKKLGKTLHLI